MKKTLAVMLLLCFIAVSLLTVLIMALHTECFCTEKLCLVCPKIFKKRAILEQLMAAVAVVLFVYTGMFAAFFYVINSDLIQIYPTNIVEANIRINA
ncbi:MAG: hypothetical protein LBC82_07755 [Oscillospiraceae bacterium]|jgi:hypothetical protein|nr:hypothetical protein [Oscillospiraceae bacterium]